MSNSGVAKLIDFSQATLLTGDKLHAKAIEADLIGIGCVLDEIVARTTPKLESDSRPEAAPETSSDASLRAVIDRAQQRKPGESYFDAKTMRADLQRAFNELYPNEAYLSAPPPSRTVPRGSSSNLHPRKGEVAAQSELKFTWFHLLAILHLVLLLLLLTR